MNFCSVYLFIFHISIHDLCLDLAQTHIYKFLSMEGQLLWWPTPHKQQHATFWNQKKLPDFTRKARQAIVIVGMLLIAMIEVELIQLNSITLKVVCWLYNMLCQETEKSTERTSHSQESRNSTGSASSSARPTLQEESPPFLLSPVASSRQKMSPRTQDYPNAGNNIKNLPPLPNSKTFATNRSKENNNMYRSNHVHRSASTREFRNLDQRKHLKPYPLKD